MIQTTTKPTPIQPRDVQVAEIGTNTQVLRSRSWERLKFEVEYSRQKGTTSNSYLIQADKTALIDPPGQSFTQIYLEALEENLDWQKLDYIVLQHVNPNRLATVQVLAGKAPRATIICSKPAVNALEAALIFPEQKSRIKVVLLYASAYGNTATMANAIAQGLLQSGVAVESVNCELASSAEIIRAIQTCDGFIIGSPTLGNHAPTQIQMALGIILANAAKTKLAGVFGSYGWSGEAIDLLENKLKDAHYNFGFEPLRVRFSPTKTNLEECQQAGQEFTQKLKKTKRIRTPRQRVTETQIDRTEQAVGRIVGSICVLTTCSRNQHKGLLTSWVSQATFNPPGVMIAVAKEQNADLISNPGDKFVLNILNEGSNVKRNFSDRHSNSLDNLITKTATNGCLIIKSALAYLECTVQNRLSSGDRWLIYAVVNCGEVLKKDGITAIQHRKSGSHY